MATNERVGDMTMSELKAMINSAVNQRFNIWSAQKHERSVSEVWQSMLNNIIEPASGTPSALEMLHEERDQWYSNT